MDRETCFHCTHVSQLDTLGKESRRNVEKIHGDVDIIYVLSLVYCVPEDDLRSHVETVGHDIFVCSKCFGNIQGLFRARKKLLSLTENLKNVKSETFFTLVKATEIEDEGKLEHVESQSSDIIRTATTETPFKDDFIKSTPRVLFNKKRPHQSLTPHKSGHTPRSKRQTPKPQTPKGKRKRLNFSHSQTPTTPRHIKHTVKESSTTCSPGPKVKVHLGFKGSSRQTILKGSRKLACRAIVMKQYKTAINHLLQLDDLKKDIYQILKKKLVQELNKICSMKDFVLRTSNLHKFSWKTAEKQLQKTCPLMMEFLSTIAGDKRNPTPRIISSAALLLFNRNSHVGAIQAINSILMFRGHVRTKVYTTFNRAGLCSSYKSTLRHVDRICQNFDEPVHNWRSRLANFYSTRVVANNVLDEHSYAVPADLELHVEKETSLTEVHVPTQNVMTQVMYTAEPLYDTPMKSSCSGSPGLSTGKPTQGTVQSAESPFTTVISKESGNISSFQIVMDNLNMMTKARHKTEETSNKVYNLVHSMAVADRVEDENLDFLHPQADILTVPNDVFIPNNEDHKKLYGDYKILIQRTLIDNIQQLAECGEDAIYHIPHQYSQESKKKSCIIPLGILEKDENITEEMIQIVEHLQQYVPQVNGKMVPLLLGGDGLSVERGEGAQRARADGVNEEDRLDGFIWKSEDWHSHVISLQETYNHHFKGTSSAERGTMFQLRNMFDHRGVKSSVKDAVNDCREFLRFLTKGYILLAALSVLELNNIDDIENNLKEKSKNEKKDFLETISNKIVQSFLTTKEVKLNQNCNDQVNQNEKKRVPCGYTGCQKTFALDGKCRINHRNICIYANVPEALANGNAVVEPDLGDDIHDIETSKDIDFKYNYSCSLLREGLQDWIREDASKENDGDRLVRMWRFDFLKFSLENHKKYRLLAFRLQAQLLALLPPKFAHELRHNRSINIHGGEGCNVPADLALEFLNMRAKDALNSLHGNMSSASIERCGKSLQGCNEVIDAYTTGLDQFFAKPSNSKPSNKNDIHKLVNHLSTEDLFKVLPGRYHRSFNKIPLDKLESLNTGKLSQWKKRNSMPSSNAPSRTECSW